MSAPPAKSPLPAQAGGGPSTKPHIRLHIGPAGLWWAESYRDCKHGWDVTALAWSARSAVRDILNCDTINRRGFLAQWPNQLRGACP
jgi:hypothetical protein